MKTIDRQPCVAQCCGCELAEGGRCQKYLVPAGQWRRGVCRDHSALRAEMLEANKEIEQKINPLKANKVSADAKRFEARQNAKEAKAEAKKKARAVEKVRAQAARDAARQRAATNRPSAGQKAK